MINTKRWTVMRKATGKAIRSFGSRASARNFKRVTSGNVMIFDNINQRAVR